MAVTILRMNMVPPVFLIHHSDTNRGLHRPRLPIASRPWTTSFDGPFLSLDLWRVIGETLEDHCRRDGGHADPGLLDGTNEPGARGEAPGPGLVPRQPGLPRVRPARAGP